MKQKIAYLSAAQIITVLTSLRSHASIYAVLIVYAIQTAITLVVLALGSMKGSGIYKLMNLLQAAMMAVIIAAIFFVILKLPGTSVQNFNGDNVTVSTAGFSAWLVVFSCFIYLFASLRSFGSTAIAQSNNGIGKNVAFFFTIFVNVAFLILAVFCLVGISGATGVILVGVLKLTLDIGTDILSHAIISLNKQLKPFNR